MIEANSALAPQPLILTAVLDEVAQARFDALRQAHFPAALNHIAAHVTMFHHLPGERCGEIKARLEAVAAATPMLSVSVDGLRPLGRGVAYTLSSPELAAVRRELARSWADYLSPQDRQGWRPHVTVQNKVHADAAKALRDTLAATFEPHAIRAEGLALWRYLGGPWEPVRRFAFSSGSP